MPPKKNFDNAPIALLSPAVGSGNIGDHFIELAIRRLMRTDAQYRRFTIRRPLTDTELAQINGCCAALICGTNLWQRDWHSALTPQVLERIRVPVIPFGVGSSAASLDDRRLGHMTLTMMRAIHERCVLGSVRDAHSERIVREAGIENITMTGCPVLYWAGKSALPAVRPGPKRRVVLTVRNWLMHRWPDAVDHPAQVAFMRSVIAGLRDWPIILAVHEEFDESLVRVLDLPESVIRRGDDPRPFIDLYSDPDNAVLALRLHAGMLGLANGVPAVFVGHDTRTYAFCEIAGLEWVELFSPDSAAEAVARVVRVMQGDTSPFAPLQARFGQLREAMMHFMAINGLPAAGPAT
jgi:polysaccharide pyruvyl transferase WcaK-like protein